MVAYFMFHAAEFTIYLSIMMVMFVLARVGNASPLVALMIAATPIIAAWMYLSPTAHGLVAGVFGHS
jgi:hypothetical protein